MAHAKDLDTLRQNKADDQHLNSQLYCTDIRGCIYPPIAIYREVNEPDAYGRLSESTNVPAFLQIPCLGRKRFDLVPPY